MINMDYTLILQGIFGGLALSLAGFAKSKKEDFKWAKMIPTLLVSGLVGGLAGFLGEDYGIVANSSAAMGITFFIESIWKAVYRKLTNKK